MSLAISNDDQVYVYSVERRYIKNPNPSTTITTPAAAASATSSDHHSKMESGVYCIVLLCLTSALWTEADATTRSADCRGSCPPGWTQLGSRCFIFKNQELNWAHAERDCIGLGGNLASFQSYTELNFVIKLVRTATGQNRIFWAGGNNAVLDGVWLWSDGSKFSPIGWGRRKPKQLQRKETLYGC
ncbi:hypothetical protein CesoFtcFv8_000340 [Champsocephalus esox]|uniref:C-type lectin domain-containing protein n=1 Tax=Champsocephalus esox TaxID=159716 RepID=A0AAN8DZK9_9TELE|nr:hypothetical protein CesoFtcFv8_000340 [Champsocephalus esox]